MVAREHYKQMREKSTDGSTLAHTVLHKPVTHKHNVSGLRAIHKIRYQEMLGNGILKDVA